MPIIDAYLALGATPYCGLGAVGTRARAEEIVRQIYLDLLDREPDPGSQGWIDALVSGRMIRAEVEREIRNSPESRNKNR